MTDFKTELISIIESDIPELRDKIQFGAVDATTAAPYLVATVPEEQPVRTKNGIAGYVTTFELSVYHTRISEAEKLKHKIIHALEGRELSEARHC